MHRVVRPLAQLQRTRALCAAPVQRRTTSAALSTGVGRDESQHVLESEFPSQPLLNTDVAQFVLDSYAQHTDRTALVDGVTGRTVTYGALIDGLKRWGAVVQKRTRAGSTTPPVVAMFMCNSPDYPMIFLGSLSVGAVVTTINPGYTAGEVARQLEDSSAQLLVVDDILEVTGLKAVQLLQQQMREAGREVPVMEVFVCGGGSSAGHSDIRRLLSDKTAPFATPVTVAPESVAVLPYSSGTTGVPKGVCVRHAAMVNNAKVLTDDLLLGQRYPGIPDVSLGLLPFYHMYGILVTILISSYTGSKIVTLPSFQPKSFVEAIRKYKPSLLPLVPHLVKYVIESKGITAEDLKGVHTVICGSSPVSQATANNFQNKTGGNIHFAEGYGMTEVQIVSLTPRNNMQLGYCGKLLAHTRAKIVNPDTGEALPIGHRGEILIKSPYLMAGYLNNPAATKAIINDDGWVHSGDIGIFHENGHFSIVDRLKDLIKVKANQVSPTELEAVMLKHPSIADVGVVGIPHKRVGEAPRAYIVKKEGMNITEEEVNLYMLKNLSKPKQLVGGIKFVDDLPKNATGKLLRRVLKATAVEES